MLYVGIDPGPSWCGFAALEVTSDDVVRVEARTYSVPKHDGYLRMARDLVDLLPHARRVHVVVEDFRIRASGHQRFDHGDTLRFLGALEYGMRSVDLFDFYLVAPNDNGARESKMLFGRVLSDYRKKWPQYRNPAWGHCLSAWRIIGYHLMKHEREMLTRLHTDAKKSRSGPQWLPALAREPHDFIAPANIWMR